MKYKVMYTAGAKKDLRNIFRYISEELLAPENAAGQTERIMTAIRKLDTMPNRNRLYEEKPWHSKGLRFFPVDNYLVFYKIENAVGAEDEQHPQCCYGNCFKRAYLSLTLHK